MASAIEAAWSERGLDAGNGGQTQKQTPSTIVPTVTPTQDDCTRVQILELVGVLPDVAHHVAHAKRRIASRGMRCSRLWTVVDLARRHRWVPLHVILALAPGIEPLIVPLRGVLPLPYFWQPLALRCTK